MRKIIATRMILWKKHWHSLLFWFAFPLLTTIGWIAIFDSVQEDVQVPIGIVVEEQTEQAIELVDQIEQSPLVRTMHVTEELGIDLLRKHELDSMFIIHEGYEEEIHKGSRMNLISSYHTDRSFAYSPVKEMIVSFVQEDTSRSKAAYEVLALQEAYNGNEKWTWDEIVDTSKEIQADENLLQTTMHFAGSTSETNNDKLIQWNPWALWSLFTVLSSFFLFDWVIKERTASINTRLLFVQGGQRSYFVYNFLFYIFTLLLTDMLAFLYITYSMNEQLSLLLLVTYRIAITLIVFLLALLFKHVFFYYCVSLALTLLLAITSGIFLPVNIENPWTLFTLLNPVNLFVSKEITSLWISISILIILLWVWFIGKERQNVKNIFIK